MKVWCFSSDAGTGALSNREDAALLPAELGPWRVVARLVLGDDHEDDREAKRLILEHGFCCFGEDTHDRG
jgi:hypothetical protein